MLWTLRFYLRCANSSYLLTTNTKCRCVCTGRQSKSFLWLSDSTKDVAPGVFSSHKKIVAASDTGGTPRPALAEVPSAPLTSSPPLLLDPPFTPVPGEARAISCGASSDAAVLLYTCGACGVPLFRSCEYASSSACGRHSSGWPSFTAPASGEALRLRVLLQRTAVRGAKSALSVSLAARGLRPEGGMVRGTRSGRCERLQCRTWREECLRDENKRCDPTVTEGCCAVCGRAVCRVVTERRQGVKYVVNPTAVMVQVERELGISQNV